MMNKQCRCGLVVEDSAHSRYCPKCHTFTHPCYTKEYRHGESNQAGTFEKAVDKGAEKA